MLVTNLQTLHVSSSTIFLIEFDLWVIIEMMWNTYEYQKIEVDPILRRREASSLTNGPCVPRIGIQCLSYRNRFPCLHS